MLKTTKILFLAMLMAGASVAIAQETTTADTAAEEAPVADAPTADAPATADAQSDLSLGTPLEQAAAANEPQIGQPYIREEFGDWALRCLKSEEGQKDPCQLYQLLQDADGNNVAEISMFPLPAGSQAAAGATIVAPLETLLTQQLVIRVDGGEARRYPFTFCNAAGCVSRVGFTAEEIALFKRGSKATVRMVPAAAPDKEVVLDVSLAGFTAGYDNSAAEPAN